MIRFIPALAGFALLAGCSTPPTPVTDAQILADAMGVVSGLTAVVAEINAAKPGSVPPNVTAYLADAQTLVTGLSSATPAATGASKLQQIDADISNVLGAVQPVAATVYPAAGVAIEAAEVVLPGIEAWVNPIITQATGVSAPAPVSATALANARKVLLIPVVGG